MLASSNNWQWDAFKLADATQVCSGNCARFLYQIAIRAYALPSTWERQKGVHECGRTRFRRLPDGVHCR